MNRFLDFRVVLQVRGIYLGAAKRPVAPELTASNVSFGSDKSIEIAYKSDVRVEHDKGRLPDGSVTLPLPLVVDR